MKFNALLYKWINPRGEGTGNPHPLYKIPETAQKRGSCGEINFSPNSSFGVFECAWWLFNLYINGVVREVNTRVLGRGLKLVDGNDNEWELNQLPFSDDTVVVADSERSCAS